ncbi:MAG TPA: PilZ domain-containing protein [bacterium]
MSLKTKTMTERRRFSRSGSGRPLGVSLLQPRPSGAVDGVNVSEGGLCLRMEEALEIRSLVRLEVSSEREAFARSRQPLQCRGRVAWVVQRLDLRDRPPFLFDIGIEFVDPSPLLREMLGLLDIAPGTSGSLPSAAPRKGLAPLVTATRAFVPQLVRESGPPIRWHLAVFADGVPCFSQRFPSQRAAIEAWGRFKRAQLRGRITG